MKDQGKFDGSIPIAILILLWINCLASFWSSMPSKKFGQRKTLLGGQICMFICHALLVIFNQLEMSVLVIITLTLFLIAFQMSMGPITFLHVQETCADSVVGFIFFLNFMFNISTGFLGSFVMERFGGSAIFIFYGLFTLFGVIYTSIFTKDTTFAPLKESG